MKENKKLRNLFRDFIPNEKENNKELTFLGNVPEWLTWHFYRNWPAKFIGNSYKAEHWFDGFAWLHHITFNKQKAIYKGWLLDTISFKNTMKKWYHPLGKWRSLYPKSSFFSQLIRGFKTEPIDDTSVNIMKLDNSMFAISDMSTIVEFDPETLKVRNINNFDDKFSKKFFPSAAHPSFDPKTREIFNALAVLWKDNYYYCFRFKNNNWKISREEIGRIKTKNPSYFHSFALTENYFIFLEMPAVLNIFKLLFVSLFWYGFSKDCISWKPELGSKIYTLDRRNGKVREFNTETFGFFHTINSREEWNNIIIDFCNTNDWSQLNKTFVIENIRYNGIDENLFPKYARLNINLDTWDVEINKNLLNENIELPIINHSKAFKEHRYVYWVSVKSKNTFINQLKKIDTENKVSLTWEEDWAYPMEPMFVAKPNSIDEDDGILLSFVSYPEKNETALILINAKNMREEARAILPSYVPYGLHGQFYAKI